MRPTRHSGRGFATYYRRRYPLTAEAQGAAILQPRQRRRVAALPRAEDRVGGVDGIARTLLFEQTALGPARARADPGGRPGRSYSSGRSSRHARPAASEYSSRRTLLDATELGDLLPLAGVEHVIGAEGQSQTAEPHAPMPPRPQTSRRLLHVSRSTIWKAKITPSTDPRSTTFGENLSPAVKPAWPGRLLDLTYADPITLKPVSRGFDPRGAGVGLWVYRRLIDPRNFQPGSYPGSSGTTLVNWPQNDYWLGPLVGAQVTKADALAHVARAKQLSLSLLYWLQTECPRPDGKTGWKGLRLRRRPGRDRRRPGQGPVYSRVTADQGRVYGA